MLQPTLVTSSRALLGGLIDYAGLFPPAGLDMAHAVAEFRQARTGSNGWIVRRFLCPASRLEELAADLAATMTAGEVFWSVGLIVDGNLGASIAAGQAFEAEMAPGASISAVEVRLAPVVAALDAGAPGVAVDAIADAVATLGDATMAYIEVDLHGDPTADVAAIADAASRGRLVAGKVRCGGTTAEAIPTPQLLADVLLAAAAVSLPLKATAGLHHPVRRHDAALDADMHGFLNLAVAQHLASRSGTRSEVVAALVATDPAEFEFGAARLVWRGHEISLRALQDQRVSGLHGFGSCSFEEPIEDLLVMGVPGVVG